MLSKLRPRLTYANVVSTMAVATGSIDSREIKNNTVRSKDVRNQSLLAKDFKPGQLPAGAPGPTGPKGDTGPPGPASLSGLGANDNFDFVRDPESTEYLDCDAPATLTLARAMNVLVIATSHFKPFGVNPAWGNCRMETNGLVDSTEHPIGGDAEVAQQGGMNLVDVQTLAPGTYTFGVSCNQESGDIAFHNIRVAAVKLAQD